MIEVPHLESAQLAIATARKQRSANEGAEFSITGVDESKCLLAREIADDRGFDVAEGGHAPPGMVGSHFAFTPGMVEARPKTIEDPIGGGLLPALEVGLLRPGSVGLVCFVASRR
jgi:hypothetical protein